MDTLLDALQEGRLIELPDNDKYDALQFLAHILEAIPSVPAGTDVVGLVMARESSVSTALGKGWACPHARVSFDEDLMCVVGWSPTGIDYGAPDGIPVSIVAMYFVPANQRNHYLREISILAKALHAYGEKADWRSAKELNEVRDDLLDLIRLHERDGRSRHAGADDTAPGQGGRRGSPGAGFVESPDRAGYPGERPGVEIRGACPEPRSSRIARFSDGTHGCACVERGLRKRRVARGEARYDRLPGRSRGIRLPGTTGNAAVTRKTGAQTVMPPCLRPCPFLHQWAATR